MVLVVGEEQAEEEEQYFAHSRYYSFPFPNRMNRILYNHDEQWLYEINFEAIHNQVFLHNEVLEYVRGIAKTKKKHCDHYLFLLLTLNSEGRLFRN